MTRSQRTQADPSANGAGPGEGPGFDGILDELLELAAGFGLDADGVMAALSLRAQGGTEWPEPRPLPGTAPVPPWPGGLGKVANAFIDAVSANTGTPPDLVGMCVMGVIAMLISGRLWVKGGPDYYEPSLLQLIVIAISGERKTPPYLAAKKPIDDIETPLQKAMQWHVDQSESDRRVLEGRIKAAEGRAIKAKDDNERGTARQEAEQLTQELADLEVAVVPRFYTRNATPEAIAKVVGAHGGVLSVFTDEARSFFQVAGQYKPKGEGDYDIFLSGWDVQRYLSDRVSRDPIDLPYIAIPYLLMGQPVVLEQMGKDKVATGLGLYARPLFAWPESRVGHRQRGSGVPSVVSDAWRDLVHRLIRQTRGIGLDEKGEIQFFRPGDDDDDVVADAERILLATDAGVREDRYVVGLTNEAQALYDEFYDQCEPRLDPKTGDLAHLGEWGNKLTGQLLRLAGTIHVLRTGRVFGVITAETMKVALEYIDYFIEHASRALRRIGAGLEVADAIHIRDWLVRHPAVTVTTRTIAVSTDWDTERVKASLEFLERYDWVRRLPTVKQPGRPGEPWALNPALYDRGAR